MDYAYIGSTQDRKRVVKGTITAVNERVATKLLASQGYQIYSLKEVLPFMPSGKQMISPISKIKPQLIITFSRQLALLLEAGNDMISALELLRIQSPNKRFKNVIGEIISDLRSGSKLSAAVGKHGVFSKIYTQSISVGEKSGNLETVLRQVADYMEKDTLVSKEIKGALRYPIIVTGVAFLVVALLVTFVLPKFVELYSALGSDLPAFTKFTLSLFKWLAHFGPYIFVGILILLAILYVLARTPDGRRVRDTVVLKLPLLGQVTHLNELVRCCRTMSLLYQAGLPVTDIMSLATDNSNNVIIKDALAKVHKELLQGERLSHSMGKNHCFLPMMVQMVSVGEETGSLDLTLMATAQAYETDAKDRMRGLIDLIQPTMTLVIGIVVALIALSLVSAMYSVYGQVG